MASVLRFFGKKRSNTELEESSSSNCTEKISSKSKCKEETSEQGNSKSNRKEKYKDSACSSTDGNPGDSKPQKEKFSKQEQNNSSISCWRNCFSCGNDKVSGAEMDFGNVDYSGHLNGVAYMPVKQNSPNYNMNHPNRGKAVIFNFDRWDNTNFPYLDLKPRLGSKKDKDDLAKCFRGLDFVVEEYNNLTCREFQDKLESLRREDHSKRDCLVVAVMTHGERNTVYLKDGILMPVNLIWEQFEANKCPTLAGKPKIFIVQACRGKKYDAGTTLMFNRNASSQDSSVDVTDSGAFSYVIPNAADIIVAFSCPLGHYSWRSPEKGSWFIQAICKVFKEHGLTMELQALFTTVAREVALHYSSQTPGHHESHNKRQVTSTSSTLIRSVYFNPKLTTQNLEANDAKCYENLGTEEIAITAQVQDGSIEEVDNMQMTSV